MGAGSLIGGALLQRKIFNHYTLMAGGALAVMAGLLLAFPPELLTPLFEIAPYTAVVGTLLAGIGDPVITVSTLRGLYSLQVKTGFSNCHFNIQLDKNTRYRPYTSDTLHDAVHWVDNI